jgi:hypothetical protein
MNGGAGPSHPQTSHNLEFATVVPRKSRGSLARFRPSSFISSACEAGADPRAVPPQH